MALLAFGLMAGCADKTRESAPQVQGRKIGVLLPLTGDFAKPAEAVLMGIKASAGKENTIISSDSCSGVTKQYKALVAAGAEVIIGPLLRDDADALAKTLAHKPEALGSRRVPTLFLNVAKNPGQRYQFALLPEHDVNTVADLLGKVRPLAVVYSGTSEPGKRLADHFALRSPGVIRMTYGKNKILNDADRLANAKVRAVLMIADAADAPEVYGQLRPRSTAPGPVVIATSHVTDGEKLRTSNGMVGLFFVDIPWIVDPERAKAFRTRTGASPRSRDDARLFAMGIDAYRLGLDLIAGKVGYTVNVPDGETGRITLGPGVLSRKLALGRFRQEHDRTLARGPATPEELGEALAAKQSNSKPEPQKKPEAPPAATPSRQTNR